MFGNHDGNFETQSFIQAFYQLVVFLLTLPVTSASRERAHSKVDIVKSSVRSSMTSERLEDFILISLEKAVLDSIELAVTVDKFAATARALLLYMTVAIIKLSKAVQRHLALVISLRVES